MNARGAERRTAGPTPNRTRTATVVRIEAAVVEPRTVSPSLKMTPAPRNRCHARAGRSMIHDLNIASAKGELARDIGTLIFCEECRIARLPTPGLGSRRTA